MNKLKNNLVKAALVSTALLFSCQCPAAEWSWTWQPGSGEGPVTAEISTFKYGKDWAYAVEIDDGPKWARSFAVPFLAEYHWTDAPPGVPGGTVKPFIGTIAVIVAVVGSNDASVNWEDLDAMVASGWGISNHSWSHSGYGWDAKGAMSDEQVAEDAYWSQALFAHGLKSGRAPTGVVYANGYVDYNRNDALKKVGIGIATRIGASSPKDVTSPQLNLMDFDRNYLDDNAWVQNDYHGNPMGGVPGADGAGPAKNTFLIDFTHGIEQSPESENQKRWKTRLSTISSKWGAGGTDALWCASTPEVADYLRAAKEAKVTMGNGTLKVEIPDSLPGTALTLRLTGMKNKTLTAPVGGTIYTKDDVVYLTTPVIGKPGTFAPALELVYEGPPGEITFKQPANVAGVTVDIGGELPNGFDYKLILHGDAGDKSFKVDPVVADPGKDKKWVVGTRLYSIVPAAAAFPAKSLSIDVKPGINKVKVWAIPAADTASAK